MSQQNEHSEDVVNKEEHHSSHHHSSGEHHSSHNSSGKHSSHHSSGEHHHSHSSESSHSHSHSSSTHSHHSGEEKKDVAKSESSSSEHSHHHHHHSTGTDERRDALINKYQVVGEDGPEDEKPQHRHHRHSRRHQRKRALKRALIALISIPLALLIVVGSTFAVMHIIGRKQVKNDGTGIKTNPYSVTYDEGKTVVYDGKTYTLNEDIVTIAAIGIDRENFGLLDDKIGTAGQADMILIAALDMKTGRISGILIPRDTMVDVDQYTVDGTYVGVDRMQVCLSFAYGDGRETSCQNVLTSAQRILYGIPIHLYGVLDLDGIATLNDAIGGVTITSLETFGEFVQGQPVTLQGEQAHTYVRNRNTEVLDSDTSRRARQMQYLEAFVRKGMHSVVEDFGIVTKLYNAAMDYAFTNVSLSRVTYLTSTLLTKGAAFDEFVSLKGTLQDADPYPEYILDEKAVFEAVLDVFYTQSAQ